MLSSKCDELRNAADELQKFIDNGHNYTWPGIVNTLHYAQQGLRDAADTIWELRNKLDGVVDQSEKIERLEAENAKLKKLVIEWYPHMLKRVGIDALRQWGRIDAMRELGIEVEDD